MLDSATRNIRVRPATSENADFVLGLVPQLVAFGPPPWRDRRQMMDTDTLVIGRALEGLAAGAAVLVAEDTGGRPLGFIHLCGETDYYTAAKPDTSPTSSSRRTRGDAVWERFSSRQPKNGPAPGATRC
jgi:hypothetical protein